MVTVMGEEEKKRRSVGCFLSLFEDRMYLAIYVAKCEARPSFEVFNLLADGIPPFPHGLTFKGMGVNEVILRAAREIGAEDEAERLMDKVDEVLEELDRRGVRRSTKKIVEKLIELRHEVLDFFKRRGYEPLERKPDPVVC